MRSGGSGPDWCVTVVVNFVPTRVDERSEEEGPDPKVDDLKVS